jgi:tetratricopeptide (TPR) repeat protein
VLPEARPASDPASDPASAPASDPPTDPAADPPGSDRPPPDPEPPPIGEGEVLVRIVAGALDEAEALARTGLSAQPDRLGFQLGIVALLRRDDEAAIEAFTAAARAGSVEASSSLGALLASRGDPEALAHTRRAVEVLGDAISVRVAVLVHLRLGDRANARLLLDRYGAALPHHERVELESVFDGPLPEIDPRHRFPDHARFAADAARAAVEEGRALEAELLLRRAVELDPADLAHAAELGTFLSDQGRDTEALASYDAAMARGGAHQLLRYNRAGCHLRAGRLAEAIADLRLCVGLVEGWHAARFNLCSALWASGDLVEARRELERLRANGAPAELVKPLAAQLGA